MSQAGRGGLSRSRGRGLGRKPIGTLAVRRKAIRAGRPAGHGARRGHPGRHAGRRRATCGSPSCEAACIEGAVSAGCRSADRAELPREPAIVLTTDDSGRTWFGYTGSRVARLEGDTVRLYTVKDGLNIGNVLAIHVQGQHVWVGGEFGLAMLAEGRFRTGDRAGTAPRSGERRASWRRPTARCGCMAPSGSRASPPTRFGA